MARRVVSLATADDDFAPGNPADIVLGKPEEKPATVHGVQPPKPNKTARVIAVEIKHRMKEIEPLIEEYEILKKLDAIFDPPPPKRGRPKKVK